MAVTMAQKLYDLRITAGFLTQIEFSRFVGLSSTQIWKAENGQEITRKTAILIVNALKKAGTEVAIEDIDWNVKKR